jgi:hypothetical protein
MNKITAGVLAASAAALVVSGCYYTTSGRPVPNPASARTTAATTAVAAPSTSALPTKPPLQPGPHSWIADVDLPEGTEECSSSMCSRDNTSYRRDNHWEFWRYSAPYDDTIAFLRDRFATGRQYDAHGATWWSGLPPCYNAIHQSPPWGVDRRRRRYPLAMDRRCQVAFGRRLQATSEAGRHWRNCAFRRGVYRAGF